MFDEVDTIHIPACRQPTADMIWCLSSNKDRIRNAQVMNRGFIKTMLDELKSLAERPGGEGLWDALQIYTDPAYLETSIGVPRYRVLTYPCMPDMPTDLALLCSRESLSKLQMAFAAGMGAEVASAVGARTVDSLEQLCLQVAAAPHERQRLCADECVITHCPIVHRAATACCKNAFEAAPLLVCAAETGKCPICRRLLLMGDVTLVMGGDGGGLAQVPDKMGALRSALVTIAEANPAYRALVFVGKDIDAVAKYIESTLGQEVAQFGGRTLNRVRFRFRNGKPPLLLFPQHRSTGVEMTEATDVVLFSDVGDNAEMVDQMIGRAQRIGRKERLTVHRVVACSPPT